MEGWPARWCCEVGGEREGRNGSQSNLGSDPGWAVGVERSKSSLGACPCRGVEWVLGYLCEREVLFLERHVQTLSKWVLAVAAC